MTWSYKDDHTDKRLASGARAEQQLPLSPGFECNSSLIPDKTTDQGGDSGFNDSIGNMLICCQHMIRIIIFFKGVLRRSRTFLMTERYLVRRRIRLVYYYLSYKMASEHSRKKVNLEAHNPMTLFILHTGYSLYYVQFD